MKIAIFGGTFDPVHLGHIELADSAVSEMQLDELYFMPNYISPFKIGEEHSGADDRIRMLEMILPYNKAFRISRYEVDNEGQISYTFDTLKALSLLHRNDKMYFLLGFDSLVKLDTWYRGPELLSQYSIIAGVRPGTNDEYGMSRIEEFRRKYNSDITILHSEHIDISSTEIRRRIASDESLKGIVTSEVEKYIYDRQLYR